MDQKMIEYYLQLVGQVLTDQGYKGEILVLGSAAMVLEMGNHYTARDIAAAFLREAPAIWSAVARIAIQERLQPNWLHDGAKGFLYTYTRPPTRLWRRYPGLDVRIAAREYLLATKVLAGRGQDLTDARALIHSLGLAGEEEVLALLQEYIPASYLTWRVQVTVEDLFL